MKVIDLLNKIAKGEEVPKHILFRNYDYFFEDNEYRDFVDHCLDYEYLNDEIEIIEEEKNIEKLDEWKFNKSESDIPHFELAQKINELIDIVKELKNEKENK